jgi:hydroxypyruvate reductase
VLLDSTALEHAAREKAASLGWNAFIDHSCDDWSAEKAAGYLVGRVRRLQAEHKPACLVSAGEVTVEVSRESAGRGGRNQHFALLASELIAGNSITVLSCGSDGIDGNSPAAGAIVDGSTSARASAAGFPVRRALETFDSFTLLEKLGDTIRTGPTGNNLRDLRILLAH